MAALAPVCAQETNGSLFSMLMLSGLREGEHAGGGGGGERCRPANLSLLVTAEEPIRGLRVTPALRPACCRASWCGELGPCPPEMRLPVEGHPSPAWSVPGRWDTGPGKLGPG